VTTKVNRKDRIFIVTKRRGGCEKGGELPRRGAKLQRGKGDEGKRSISCSEKKGRSAEVKVQRPVCTLSEEARLGNAQSWRTGSGEKGFGRGAFAEEGVRSNALGQMWREKG